MELQYLTLLQEILDNGQLEQNRTGIPTYTLPGAMLKFDMRDGFPAVTTKKLAFKSVVGELIAFLRGYRNVRQFQELGCNVWDANAQAPAWQDSPYRDGMGDLGRIYGVQWRDWSHNGDHYIDQIENALAMVRHNPESRRIIVTAWNPAEINQAALPPCHVLFQLLPRSDGTLHMTMYQRSCDMFLGVPFNIASYALLLNLFAKWTGRTAATLTMFLADAHIYQNHVQQVNEQLIRNPYPAPTLRFVSFVDNCETLPLQALLEELRPEDIELEDYEHHPAIKAAMAV